MIPRTNQMTKYRGWAKVNRSNSLEKCLLSGQLKRQVILMSWDQVEEGTCRSALIRVRIRIMWRHTMTIMLRPTMILMLQGMTFRRMAETIHRTLMSHKWDRISQETHRETIHGFSMVAWWICRLEEIGPCSWKEAQRMRIYRQIRVEFWMSWVQGVIMRAIWCWERRVLSRLKHRDSPGRPFWTWMMLGILAWWRSVKAMNSATRITWQERAQSENKGLPKHQVA